jgi:hypothetical protein
MMTSKSLFKGVINKTILVLILLLSSHVQAKALYNSGLLLQYVNLEYSIYHWYVHILFHQKIVYVSDNTKQEQWGVCLTALASR